MNSEKSRSAQGAFGLERQFVTSQDIYDLESRQIFGKNWICIDHVSQLAGDCVKPISIDDNQLIIVGDELGKFRCFRNFCRHRGSMLVTGQNCHDIGKRIQCPYHAWTYNRDGALAAAPNMDGVEDFVAADFGLIEVACEVFGGFVWVNLHPQQAITEFLAPLASQFTDYQIPELFVARELCYDVNANWKLIFQNYSECYHCPTVHPILNRLTPYKDSSNEVEAGPILGGPMRLAADCETMSMDGKRVAVPILGANKEQQRSVNYYTVFPTIFLSTHPDYVLIHRLQRQAVNSTRVICQFLFHANGETREDLEPSRAIEFWDMTNRQDWRVCELAQEGMQDPAYIPGPYSDLESVVAAFDRHYQNALKI